MGLALLFPGQGAQRPDMLPWLQQRPGLPPLDALAALAAALGPDWRAHLHDPGWLHTNRVAQPLLTGLSLAAWQAIADQLPPPLAVAGYSVGELAAFAVAGAIDPGVAIQLVVHRARAMDDCAQGFDGGLLSLQGPGAQAWASGVAGLHEAIRISPERVIVGGPRALLDTTAQAASSAGLSSKRLPIGVASHTPWMGAAAEAMAQHLRAVGMRPPRTAIVCNLTGAASRDPRHLEAALAGQMAAPVRWGEAMDTLAERGARCVLEVGPGATLSALWRERHPDIPARSVDEFRGPEGIADWVRSQLR